MISIPVPRVRHIAAASLSSLVLAAPVHAESGADTALKNTAIAGSLATWAYALFKGSPVGGCLVDGARGPGSDWGFRLQGGKDSELKYGMLAAERRNCHLTDALGFSLDVSPVIGVSAWEADSDSAYAHHAWDLAYVPMMHWRTPVAGGVNNFDVEFGIGPDYLSKSSIGDRVKSTNFQFSDHFGLGFGSASGSWRVGFEFRHLSNLSIKTPNTAVDFKGIAFSYRP